MQQLRLPHLDEMMMKEIGRVKATRGFSGMVDYSSSYMCFDLDMGAEVVFKTRQVFSEEKGHWVPSGRPTFFRHLKRGDRVTIIFLKG